MRKPIVSILLLLGAGVALGAVSQRVLVTRAVSAPECAVARCASTSPVESRTPGSGVLAEHAGTHAPARVDTGAALLASKPMPDPLPQPELYPSAWITPYVGNEVVDIASSGEDIVVKTLTLPAGRYMVLGTLDTTTYISGLCELQAKADTAGFHGVLDMASVGARETPGWDPRNEINLNLRVVLQGAVDFPGSGGEVRVVCRSFFDSAYTLGQMYVQRPVLSAQLQRAIVLAPP